jgi:hypothetical protein
VGCTNPRLDTDNVGCDRALGNPLNPDFCSPENINLDNPKDGDRFVVGVNHYANNAGTNNVKPHVNLYCNGTRVLSAGYNPATGQLTAPLLTRPGADNAGDFWTVATIAARVDGGQLVSCDVTAVPSRHADPTRDGVADGGPASICVDSKTNMTPAPFQFNYTSHKFVDPGSGQGLDAGLIPVNANQWCKH